MWINSLLKKLKLGLWVSLFCLALPYSTSAQSTTIKVQKEYESIQSKLSLSYIVYSNGVLNRELIKPGLKIVTEGDKVQITKFKLFIYKDKNLVELLKIDGNILTPEAINKLKTTYTNDPISITVQHAIDKYGKTFYFPTFFFFVK